jgi:hypothetical protein
MIKRLVLPVATLILAACNDPHSYKKAEDAQDAGRQFIRASLDGDIERAGFYLYADSTNKIMFTKWKKVYDRMSPDEQQKYKDASILPIEIKAINDSVTSYTYSNSYKKDTTTVRVVRINGEWLVDLKEILNHDHRNSAMR